MALGFDPRATFIQLKQLQRLMQKQFLVKVIQELKTFMILRYYQ